MDTGIECGYIKSMTTTGMVRWNTKRCKGCGSVTSLLATAPGKTVYAGGSCASVTEWGVSVEYSNGRLIVPCRTCGRRMYASAVIGKNSVKHECNAKCQASTGHQCECSCGGKNHGASFAA